MLTQKDVVSYSYEVFKLRDVCVFAVWHGTAKQAMKCDTK